MYLIFYKIDDYPWVYAMSAKNEKEAIKFNNQLAMEHRVYCYDHYIEKRSYAYQVRKIVK